MAQYLTWINYHTWMKLHDFSDCWTFNEVKNPGKIFCENESQKDKF